MEIVLIILMVVGVLMIPAEKPKKRDNYSDEVIEYISGKPTMVDLRDKI